MNKLKNLFVINSIVFISFLTLVELILGNWKFFNSPVTKIPGAPFSRKFYRDVGKIYGLKKPYYISNTRDKKGYRSTKDYNQNDIILTIGGSTTAQLLVDDDKTWQNIISNRLYSIFQLL